MPWVGRSEPCWQGDDAEQREFVRRNYGEEALTVFMRGATMALDNYVRDLPDRMPEKWYRDKYGALRQRGETAERHDSERVY